MGLGECVTLTPSKLAMGGRDSPLALARLLAEDIWSGGSWQLHGGTATDKGDVSPVGAE